MFERGVDKVLKTKRNNQEQVGANEIFTCEQHSRVTPHGKDSIVGPLINLVCASQIQYQSDLCVGQPYFLRIDNFA